MSGHRNNFKFASILPTFGSVGEAALAAINGQADKILELQRALETARGTYTRSESLVRNQALEIERLKRRIAELESRQ